MSIYIISDNPVISDICTYQCNHRTKSPHSDLVLSYVVSNRTLEENNLEKIGIIMCPN